MATSSRPIQSVSNTELYSRWAKYYDVDGNILQAIDDIEMPQLMQQFFHRMPQGGRAKITELGCGTGRNTAKLLQAPFVDLAQEIHGLDLSDEMIQLAQKRCDELRRENRQGSGSVAPVFDVFDVLAGRSPPVDATDADGVISTLVLEHLPIGIFFETVGKLLKKDGYLLLTNMHEEMGNKSQAGFLDVETGKKLQGQSFVYSVEEVLLEAERKGFKLDGVLQERAISADNLGIVGDRGRKWLGCQVWFGCVLRYDGV